MGMLLSGGVKKVTADKLQSSLRSCERSGAGAMEFSLGDIVALKKQHPCGSQEWEVLRVGMDFRLRCLGCDHQVMISRKQLEKSVRKITPKNEGEMQV